MFLRAKKILCYSWPSQIGSSDSSSLFRRKETGGVLKRQALIDYLRSDRMYHRVFKGARSTTHPTFTGGTHRSKTGTQLKLGSGHIPLLSPDTRYGPPAGFAFPVCQIHLGDVIAHFNAKRGKIEGMEIRSGAQVIKAKVPLSEMFGYATDLRSMTQGRGTYSMQFNTYDEVPQQISEGLLARIYRR